MYTIKYSTVYLRYIQSAKTLKPVTRFTASVMATSHERDQGTQRRVTVLNAPCPENLRFTASQALNVRTIIP